MVRNLEKWIFFKLTDMVTFQTNTSSTVKKLQISISFESNYRKQYLCYLLFLKWWKPRFLISERVFHWFLRNYKEFAHETSHIQPSKYDSTSGTKISICLKKIEGMRLWIRTSTFKDVYLYYWSLPVRMTALTEGEIFNVNIALIKTPHTATKKNI